MPLFNSYWQQLFLFRLYPSLFSTSRFALFLIIPSFTMLSTTRSITALALRGMRQHSSITNPCYRSLTFISQPNQQPPFSPYAPPQQPSYPPQAPNPPQKFKDRTMSTVALSALPARSDEKCPYPAKRKRRAPCNMPCTSSIPSATLTPYLIANIVLSAFVEQLWTKSPTGPGNPRCGP